MIKKKIEPLIDLTDIDLQEIVILDKKRAFSEGIRNEANMPVFHESKKNSIGALIVHDLGSSPKNMQFYNKYIYNLGYTTYISRIVGHSSNYKYLKHFTFIDWYESLKYGYNALAKTTKSIYVIGKGFGSFLAILISMFNKVDRLILIIPQIDKPKIGRFYKNRLNIFKNNIENLDYIDNSNDYRFIPKKTIKEANSLIKYLLKNIDKYNKNIPITIHTFESNNVVYYYKGMKLFSILKNKGANIEIFNMELLNKFMRGSNVKQ